MKFLLFNVLFIFPFFVFRLFIKSKPNINEPRLLGDDDDFHVEIIKKKPYKDSTEMQKL